jgi:hypothetical protein
MHTCTACWYRMCLDKLVDADVDLVFIEYTVNDGHVAGGVDHPRVKAFERLMCVHPSLCMVSKGAGWTYNVGG